MPDGSFAVFRSVPVIAVALVRSAALREHGSRVARLAAHVFPGIAAVPALSVGWVGCVVVAGFGEG
ncbi:hypothetical protein ACFYS8_35530 [Kitasatospora sp. NPDC004615]|uniref:hypothetical protein n=1 Tax=Kitasatospora sp. NPDC004615 TaxID=3364017 RepID=UPI0036C3E6DD